ncbi:MAG: hypothetical protein PHX08_01755 [Lachnospiraceae bacterium]|nr:hypothetical protein [Lachnospiraceae bacterium]
MSIVDNLAFKNKFGYGGITPQLCKNLQKTIGTDRRITLTWTDPGDTFIDGILVSSWAKTIIVKKSGSYPQNIIDGETVVENTVRNQYEDTGYIDEDYTGTTDNLEQIYYMAFPAADTGATSINISNRFSEFVIYGFVENMSVLDPTARITYLGENAAFTSAKMDYTNNVFNYGSWGNWSWLKKVQPYMVDFSGNPDYKLNPNNYAFKEDGITASDVSNQNYQGGAYTWIPKIYTYQYIEGNLRYVYFCEKKADANFRPVGFIDYNEAELEGIWIPMFYGSVVSSKMRSISGTTTINTQTTATEYTYLQNAGVRHVFFGGSIINTLTDILYMMARNTNSQAAYGAGFNTGGTAAASLKANVVIGGGMFYGTNGNNALNKIFHSIVLGSYQIWQRNPYEILYNGIYRVSPYYKYSLTAENYINTGIQLPTNGAWIYPNIMRHVPEYGVVPAEPAIGSTALGYCDGLIANTAQISIGLRFGVCNTALIAGLSARALNHVAGPASWAIGASDLLLPPVGVAA